MSAREFWLIVTNVLLGAFVLTCLILVIISTIGEIIRGHGARERVKNPERKPADEQTGAHLFANPSLFG
ncbi:MAG: hypothetical protein ACE15B_08020 [Bryobacteraceae bacterium]